MPSPAAGAGGTIYDIGYRRYDGARLGRPYAVRMLFAHGLRAVFAVGRGPRARATPLALAALALMPAVMQTTIAALTRNQASLLTYWSYILSLAMIFALFCAAQAPELVSADLRSRALVLYLARALRRDDYVLARVFSLAVAVFLLTVAPLLVIFAGKVFLAAAPWAAFRAEAPMLPPILATAIMVALLMATVSVAISSFTPRRALASAGVLGFFVVSAGLSQVARLAISAPWAAWLALLNPFLALGGFAYGVFGAQPAPDDPLAGLNLPGWSFGAACLAYITLALGILLVRYGRMDA